MSINVFLCKLIQEYGYGRYLETIPPEEVIAIMLHDLTKENKVLKNNNGVDRHQENLSRDVIYGDG